MASDWHQLGRIMPIEELEHAIESLTLDRVRGYYTSHPPRNLSVVTLGPSPLEDPNDLVPGTGCHNRQLTLPTSTTREQRVGTVADHTRHDARNRQVIFGR